MIQNKLQTILDTVLNPQGQPTHGIKPLSMTPRPKTLDGKTIYLVDIGFGGGYEFLREMQGWFAKHMPAVQAVLRRKAGNMFMDDPDLWAEIKKRDGVVVMGVGG